MKEFARGQKSKLADITPETQLRVGLNVTAPSSSVFDISCFGVDADGKLSDDRYFIFYNQKASPCGSVVALGPQSGDLELFQVDLAKLPATIRKLVFTITLEGAGAMSQILSGHLRLLAGGIEVARFPFSGRDFSQEKAIIVSEIYFKDGWRFAAVGQGFNGGLSALLKHFGGEEISPPTPPPTQPPKVNLGKVTLEKKGDKRTVDLRKGGQLQPIHINLNWDNPQAGQKQGFFGRKVEAPDLDLGCMFRTFDGSQGVIQPVGNYFGARDQPPYILLDKDDRSGAAADGENLYIYRPDLIDLVMVFAFIYQGATDFTQVNGRLMITDHSGNQTFIRLNSPDGNQGFCSICTIRKVGDAVEVTKEERYFRSHPEADQFYGFGFSWGRGSK